MVRILTLLAALLAWPALAQEGEIQAVISDQLGDFQTDDFEGAFDHASPGIRQLFGTPGRFGTMVRQGYPMVYRPGDVRFLNARPVGEGIDQMVQIRDGAGAFHVLEYRMIQVDGVWRVDGVRIVEGEQLGV